MEWRSGRGVSERRLAFGTGTYAPSLGSLRPGVPGTGTLPRLAAADAALAASSLVPVELRNAKTAALRDLPVDDSAALEAGVLDLS